MRSTQDGVKKLNTSCKFTQITITRMGAKEIAAEIEQAEKQEALKEESKESDSED